MSDIIVVKIGGSTLGSHDTALADIVELQRRGLRPVVVHGGGALISEWLARHQRAHALRERPPRHRRGVARGRRRGPRGSREQADRRLPLRPSAVRAIGLSGADGWHSARPRPRREAWLRRRNHRRRAPATAVALSQDGVIPVIAPIALEWQGEKPTAQLLNINADTAAGAIAAALQARWLVLLTDVPGVRDGGRRGRSAAQRRWTRRGASSRA